MTYHQIVAYFGESLVTKKPDPILKGVLSIDTLNFLYQVGLPATDNLIDVEPTTDTTIVNRWNSRYLPIGICTGMPLCIKIGEDERAVLLSEKEIYVNKNIEYFFRSIYICDYFHEMVIESKLGVLAEKRQGYVNYLSQALIDIDPAIQLQDYFWMGIVESLEFGLIYWWPDATQAYFHQNVLEQLYSISIRGRMAFGIHCLEKSLRQLAYETPVLAVLIDRLTEFVETDRLDIWESRIGEVAPYALLDTHPDNDLANYETLTVDEAQTLKNLYATMPAELTDLIDAVVNIGESNLYGSAGERSEDSLKATQLVTEKMAQLDVAIPDVSPYLRSSFTENNGWGFTRSISMFE